MRKIYLFFSVILFLHLTACSKKIIYYERSGEVEFVNSEKNTITVETKSFAENFSKAVVFAEMNALENILFRGIPGSNQESPMINEKDVKNNKALNELIFNDGYRKYLISSRNLYYHKSSGLYYITQEIKFDLNALRKYLEDNAIIRKFGM